MPQPIWRRLATAALVAAAVAAGTGAAAPRTIGQARVANAAGAAPVTLSVYTCCGSLAGFNDTHASDLSSMHAIYAHLWARLFPTLRWRETSFGDQASMEQALAVAVKDGHAPDLVFVQGGDAGYLVLRHLAQPLDRFIARRHVSDASFLPGMAHWAHFGGHWWAIPAVSGPLGGQQIYLPKYLTPLGYNNSNLRTFGDYYQMSRKAVRFDAAGNLTRIGYWPGVDSWETIGTLMCPRGHGLYNAADQPTATDPCNAAYLGYLKKLVDLYGGYAKLTSFLAADPDPNWSKGDPKAFVATGKVLLPSQGVAYWNISPLDANSFGVKSGVSYQLTLLPPTPHGSEAEAATYPSTMQEVIIPPGAAHPDLAFSVSAAMFWDNGYLLGRSLSGSPMADDQARWLGQAISGEAAVRRLAGLPGNPAATLAGLRMQPALGRLSVASSPLNPVDPFYQRQLIAATVRVLSGQQSIPAALQGVQRSVLAQERRLKAQYGAWNW